MAYWRIDRQFFTVFGNLWYPGLKIYMDKLNTEEEVLQRLSLGEYPPGTHVTRVGEDGKEKWSQPVEAWLYSRESSNSRESLHEEDK